MRIALRGLTKQQVESLIIAYEPIWAIGTGMTATSKQADEVCEIIREIIFELYGDEAAEKIVIQYGGSIKPSNAKELFDMINIDGGLVGGASIKLSDFARIVNY